MIEQIARLSDHIVTALAEGGYPRLKPLLNGDPGRIIIADRSQLEQFMPPRIIFIPVRGDFTHIDPTRGTARVSQNKPYDAGSKAVISQPPIYAEEVAFEVSAWSVAPEDTPNPGEWDFVYTRALYHQIIESAHELMVGSFKILNGQWRRTAHLKRVGREFVFGLTILMPVLRTLPPLPKTAPRDPLTGLPPTPGLPFAPAGTAAKVTDGIVVNASKPLPGDPGPAPTPEPGCEEPE